jgi:hypothetical protein
MANLKVSENDGIPAPGAHAVNPDAQVIVFSWGGLIFE